MHFFIPGKKKYSVSSLKISDNVKVKSQILGKTNLSTLILWLYIFRFISLCKNFDPTLAVGDKKRLADKF